MFVDKLRCSFRPVLVVLVLVVFAVAPFGSGAEVVDRIVAVVNEDIILLSDMERNIEEYRAMAKEAGQEQAAWYLTPDQRSQLLEKLVNDKLLEQEAKRLGITISEGEVDSAIDRVRQINKISQEEMLRYFKLQGMEMGEYREKIKEQLLQSRIVNREVKSKVVITEEQLKEHYQANIQQYAGQTKYHLRHILMQTSSPAPDERERVYRNMEQVRVRLKKGETFSDLAKAFSQAGTAREGGDLGLFESRLLADNIREALNGVKAGGHTGVVETEQGYQIFYVEDVVNVGGKSFEDVKEEIHEKLFTEITERRFEEWFKQLRQRAHISILE